MAKGVDRITMFKIAEEDIPDVLEQFKVMERDAKKDGQPYILSVLARRTSPDPRSRGFTVVSQTTFASLDDMKYYDDHCEAHAALKKAVGAKLAEPRMENIMTIYMDRE